MTLGHLPIAKAEPSPDGKWVVRVAWRVHTSGFDLVCAADIKPSVARQLADQVGFHKRFELMKDGQTYRVPLGTAAALELAADLRAEAGIARDRMRTTPEPDPLPTAQVRRVLSYINGERDDGFPHPPEVQQAMDDLAAWVRVKG